MDPIAEKPHISPSQLSRYFTCGEQYRRIYVMKERIPPGVALLKGSAVHEAAEVHYRKKVEDGTGVAANQILDLAAQAFRDRVAADGLELTAEEVVVGEKIILGSAVDSVVRMASVFHREIAPTVAPVLVEHRVRVALPMASHDMLGIVDVTDADDIVHDLKTSVRSKSPEDMETDQFAFYSAAFETLTGRPAAGVQMDVVIDSKTPKSQQMRSRRTVRDTGVLANRINAMLAGLQAGVFLPATPGHWACTQRFCGFWRTCPFVNAERRAAAESHDG